jgi:hypothetical protein
MTDEKRAIINKSGWKLLLRLTDIVYQFHRSSDDVAILQTQSEIPICFTIK